MSRVGRFRLGLYAAVAIFSLAVTGSVPTPAHSAPLDDLLPPVRTSLVAQPAPVPVPSEGRLPVSLRLANSIWTDDGSHPPPSTKLRFEFARELRLDLSGVPRCSVGLNYAIRTEESPCEKEKIATGRIKVEVAFPEEEPILVSARAIAFKVDRGKIMIRAYLVAPITGEIFIPVAIGRAPAGIYGSRATATIPKIAGGFGSLVYLGLRFSKGLFSVACPQRRLQSGVTDTFADGTSSAAGFIVTC